MINKVTIFLLLAVLFYSCQQDIDDYYYKDTEASVDTDILSLLKQNADYSEFVSLLEQTQIDTLLDQGKVFTFFVPNNAAMNSREQGTLGDNDLIEYLMTESYVNLNQINGENKIQTLSGKFAVIERVGGLSYTLDNVDIVQGSPLANNGRYYEIEEVVLPKPSLYEYIAVTNDFYRDFLDSRDSVFLDKELSTPIGYTDDGLTIYDTVLTTINRFEEEYFPVTEEFRDYKATMLLFTQEQYDDALTFISDELAIPINAIADIWQNEELMPYLLEQSVFRNALDYSAFIRGRAKNILGDSVDVDPLNISPEFFECSNGRVYSLIDFEVPEFLYKKSDTTEMASLLTFKGSGLYDWSEEVEVTGQTFNPQLASNGFGTFGTTLLVDMGKNFSGDFSLAYKYKNMFPANYKLSVRANVSKTGIYNIFVNGKQYPVDINDGRGPQYDFDFFNLRNGVVSSVTYEFYPFENNFSQFDILVDNITEFGDVEVKLEYKGPGRNRNNSGLNIDLISLEYFKNNN